MDTKDEIRELREEGFCVLKKRFAPTLVEACRQAFWPVLSRYLELHGDEPNRGTRRHFLPMPFTPPCFRPEFFFDAGVLSVVHGVMDERVVADQWGCDVPVRGSIRQEAHVDFRRPLFAEEPDLLLPPYQMVVSFGLARIARGDGPIEIAAGTHRMVRQEGLRAVQAERIAMQPVPLEVGDVLIRHPWALHRGTPNTSETPRALVSIRYVRRWYADDSREVNAMPRAIWEGLTVEQRSGLRFAVEE